MRKRSARQSPFRSINAFEWGDGDVQLKEEGGEKGREEDLPYG